MHVTRRRAAAIAPARGFTLIELLVTLVVIAIGLLGLSKLQAAATAETQVSRTRSIMAVQAESLAASMRANRSYWANETGALPTITVAAGGAVTSTDTTAADTNLCAAFCSPATLAATDVKQWASNFGAQFPAASATIACSDANPPVACDITLSWPERYVAINRTTAPAAGDTPPTGTLVVHVQP
jgi:type IV pilus assembly protein PilV